MTNKVCQMQNKISKITKGFLNVGQSDVISPNLATPPCLFVHTSTSCHSLELSIQVSAFLSQGCFLVVKM